MTNSTHTRSTASQVDRSARLLRPREVEEILGLSRQTIKRLVEAGELAPIYVSSRRPRYAPADVEAFVQRRRQAAAP